MPAEALVQVNGETLIPSWRGAGSIFSPSSLFILVVCSKPRSPLARYSPCAWAKLPGKRPSPDTNGACWPLAMITKLPVFYSTMKKGRFGQAGSGPEYRPQGPTVNPTRFSTSCPSAVLGQFPRAGESRHIWCKNGGAGRLCRVGAALWIRRKAGRPELHPLELGVQSPLAPDTQPFLVDPSSLGGGVRARQGHRLFTVQFSGVVTRNLYSVC